MKKISLISFLLATTALAIFTSATIRKIDTIQSNTATDITIDPSGDLILTSATANTVPYFNATKKLLSSVVTDTELAYLSGVTSAIQDQLDDKAADADVVKLTGDQSISDVKTFTGQFIASSTTKGFRPCPVMNESQRDSIVSPGLGDCVTNSTQASLNVYNGSEWGAVGGGGGGGGSFVWELNGLSSPVESVLNNSISVFDFDAESNHEIFASLVVPETYTAGDQIKMKGIKFVINASGSVLLRSQTSLIKVFDDITVTPPVHTSTNLEVSFVSAQNSVYELDDLDLTDSSGEIDGNAVQAGDVLVIKFYRDNINESSSANADCRVFKYSASVKFDG